MNTDPTRTQYTSHHHNHTPVVFNSRLYEHNTSLQNQKLYDPLRNAVSHPGYQYQRSHQIAQQHALKSSHIAHNYRHLSDEQYRRINQQTLITNDPLKPTHHYQKVANKNYFILDATEREGKPINQDQMKEIIAKSRLQDEIIVYDKSQSSSSRNQVKPQKMWRESAQKSIQKGAKYNLYSMLDEPFQRVKTSGCKAFKCAQNQCIASEKKYSWFN